MRASPEAQDLEVQEQEMQDREVLGPEVRDRVALQLVGNRRQLRMQPVELPRATVATELCVESMDRAGVPEAAIYSKC